jgi:hypothetical protein
MGKGHGNKVTKQEVQMAKIHEKKWGNARK